MFDSVAFNVVLGMVFIYLLYSLLATILTEIISTWLDLRATTLLLAVRRMLEDGDPAEEDSWQVSVLLRNFWRTLRGGFRRLSGGSMPSAATEARGLAARFYLAPGIKYLSTGKRGLFSLFGPKRPAYFSRDFFAKTVVHLLREKGAGTTDSARIMFCLEHNTLGIGPETLKHLRNLFIDANHDAQQFAEHLGAWFDETMDRATGWFKSKQRWVSFLIGLAIAVSLNVDSVRIARMLSKDKTARDRIVEMGIAYGKDSTKAGYIIAHAVDTVKSKAVIDSSFNLIQQDLSDAKYALGLGWDFSKLRTRDSGWYDASPEDLLLLSRIGSLNDSVQRSETLALQLSQTAVDSARVAAYRARERVLQANRKELGEMIAALNHSFTSSFVTVESVPPPLRTGTLKVKGMTEAGLPAKIGYVLMFAWHSSTSVLGWFLTALALSMGAPFWFGLLQKLVSLRGSGIKPEEKEQPKGDNPPGATAGAGMAGAQRQQDGVGVPSPAPALSGPTHPPEPPVTAALRIYGETLQSEQGVLNLAAGLLHQEDGSVDCVDVHLDTQDNTLRFQLKYRELVVDGGTSVPVVAIKTGRARIHAGPPDGYKNQVIAVANTTLANGWGTATCCARDTGGTIHLLSCFHVLSGDEDLSRRSSETKIISDSGVVALLDRGIFDDQFDLGIATMTDGSEGLAEALRSRGVYRELEAGDSGHCAVRMRGARSGIFAGTVQHSSFPMSFDLDIPGGRTLVHSFRNLIKIRHGDSGGPIDHVSQPGDSGALVADEHGVALGYVIGSDEAFTYAVHISPILRTMKWTLL